MKNFSEIKTLALQACAQAIDSRLAAAQFAMQAAQDAANQEEKSSAGDKYETGRAMAQLERDKAAEQVAEALKMKEAFSRIGNSHTTSIELGSLVFTDQGIYLISVAIGKLSAGEFELHAISSKSPIGGLLMNKRKGDKISFNGRTLVIEDVV